MARKLIGVLALGVVLAVPAVANASSDALSSWDDVQRFEPGEALVRYGADVNAAERRDVRDAAGVDFEGSLALPHSQVVSFHGSVKDAIARLEDQPGVVDAQPNYIYKALAAAPNDSFFGQEWGLGGGPGVNVLPAWDRTRGAGQTIAVVDTGVDLTHPDLVGNLVPGHDFIDNDDVPDDFNLHGTHVAGTAAADDDNGIGVSGVAPAAKIMPVRALDADGSGNSANIANGILFAADNGATVINLSIGGPAGGGDGALSAAIEHAGQRNVVVVSAAGNDNNNNDVNPTTPCTLDPPTHNNICVAAVTPTGARSDFSNFGASTVDVGAPGGDGSGTPAGDVLSTKPAWTTAFSENFESGTDGWTASGTSTWGLAGSGIGTDSITDSPAGDYLPNTDSNFQHSAVDLSGRRGCRLDFWIDVAMDDISPTGDPFDLATVGINSAGPTLTGAFFAPTNGFFQKKDKAMNAFDGRNDVLPTFGFHSDDSVQGDGVYIDDFSINCRGNSYPNSIGGEDADDGGDYTAIAGTSMAAPHVSGVAALVRAVDPGAPASQVVQAIMEGSKPDAGMAGVTVTGGVADAVGAMDRALAIPNPVTRPHKPRVRKVTVSRRGVITMVISGDAGNRGKVTLKANITAARVRTVAKKSFRLSSRGRATVKLKPSKPALKQLKRKHRLKLRAKVVVKNAAGASNSVSGTIRLRLRRR
ncbi:MAG TPA: S8 family serine peptidase [Thermoleophilaceae bacterium]